MNAPLGGLKYQRKLPQSCRHEELQGSLKEAVEHDLGMKVPKSIPCLLVKWLPKVVRALSSESRYFTSVTMYSIVKGAEFLFVCSLFIF